MATEDLLAAPEGGITNWLEKKVSEKHYRLKAQLKLPGYHTRSKI